MSHNLNYMKLLVLFPITAWTKSPRYVIYSYMYTTELIKIQYQLFLLNKSFPYQPNQSILHFKVYYKPLEIMKILSKPLLFAYEGLL